MPCYQLNGMKRRGDIEILESRILLDGEGAIIDAGKLDVLLSQLERQFDDFVTDGRVTNEFRTANGFQQINNATVVVDAIAHDDPAMLLAQLKKLGAQDATSFGQVVSGSIPLESLSSLRDQAELRFARSAQAVTNIGATTTQGDVAQRSDQLRLNYGLTGDGVSVGVLSDSFSDARASSPPTITSAAQDVASGDLPSGIVVLDELSGAIAPGIDEGRAMMQIIHDVAPNAQLGFHTAFKGTASFALGIQELAGCPAGSAPTCRPDPAFTADVIVDDVTYLSEPFFQDGIIAQAVDTVYDAGVAYFTSAGNQSRKSYESPFRPSGETQPVTGYEFHDFDPGPGVDTFQRITVPIGASPFISFQWADPYFSICGPSCGGAISDLDIWLYNSAGGLAGGYSNLRNIGNDPIEGFSYNNNGPDTVYDIAITRKPGSPAPALMKYMRFDARGTTTVDEYDTSSGTIIGHHNARGAESVGASDYAETQEFGTVPPTLQSFSSAGGSSIKFDLSGSPIDVVRMKPEIVAPDNANTTFFFYNSDPESDGFPNFRGTSAAAPHAAGVAALLLEATPSISPAELYAALENSAIDMDDPSTPGFDLGFDEGTGHGLIDASKAIALGSISDGLWEDLNHNGIRDESEPAMDAAAVELLDTRLRLVESTTTVNGFYQFSEVAPGNYFVRFGKPPGFQFSPRDQGIDDALDSDANPQTGLSHLVSINFDQHITHIGAGLRRQPPPVTDTVFVSLSGNAAVRGIPVNGEDIIAFDVNSGEPLLYFDGSRVGIANEQIDAFYLQADGSLLMSLNTSADFSFGRAQDSDIVRFLPTGHGTRTNGSFEMFLDGSDIGLDQPGEGIDAISFASDGRLIVSTRSRFSVPGLKGSDTDLLVLNDGVFGDASGGTWELYLDGSSAELTDHYEDVSGVSIDNDSGNIHLTSRYAFSVPGAAGESNDIFSCVPRSADATMGCAYNPLFDGEANGLSGTVQAIHVGEFSGYERYGIGRVYLSVENDLAIGGLNVADEDVFYRDNSTGAWHLYFDGSDVGLTTDMDGFHILATGEILFSLSTFATIADVGDVDSQDIVRFTPTMTGTETDGTFSMELDGSDVNLESYSENIDAISYTDDGRLVVSTTAAYSVDGLHGTDADLLSFMPSSLGWDTQGTWETLFEGSDASLTTRGEDVTGTWVDPGGTEIAFNTLRTFSVPGLTGSNWDIFGCLPVSLGENATCAEFESRFAGADSGITQAIDGIHFETLDPPTVVADLSIPQADMPDPIEPGAALSYANTVSYAGPSPAEDIVVTDLLPTGATLIPSSGCREDPAGVSTCGLGTIPAGGSTSIREDVWDTSIDTVTGANDDIFACTPESLGSETSCTDIGIRFAGMEYRIKQAIDGIHIGSIVAQLSLAPRTGFAALRPESDKVHDLVFAELSSRVRGI